MIPLNPILEFINEPFFDLINNVLELGILILLSTDGLLIMTLKWYFIDKVPDTLLATI